MLYRSNCIRTILQWANRMAVNINRQRSICMLHTQYKSISSIFTFCWRLVAGACVCVYYSAYIGIERLLATHIYSYDDAYKIEKRAFGIHFLIRNISCLK